MVKVSVVEECFRDHWAFPDIQDEETLSRELMFDPMFLDQDDQDANDKSLSQKPLSARKCYVPKLMLLGILYCRSNRRQRAEKLYALFQHDLNNLMQDDDPDYRLYVPLIYEIAYKLMFRLYNRHRDCTPGTEVWPARQPEIEDMAEFVPQDTYLDERIKEIFTEDFNN